MDFKQTVAEVGQLIALRKELAEASGKLIEQQSEIERLKIELRYEQHLKLLWRRWYDNEAAVTDNLRDRLKELVKEVGHE